MRLSSTVLIVIAATAAASSAALATQRSVYVSAAGADSTTCGTYAAPCATVQYSLDNIVAPGGVIVIKGGALVSTPITIRASVSIIADSGATAVFQVGGKNDGVFVDAGASGVVTLKGLTFTSMSTIPSNGIYLNSAAKFDVIDCLVQNFSGDGIDISSKTPALFGILRTTVINSGGTGISVIPQSGGSAKGSIDDTEVLGNAGYGVTIDASSGAAFAYIQNTRSNFNGGVGFAKITGGSFRLASSTATGNAGNIASAGGGGPGYSYQNNFLTGNTDDGGINYLTNNTPN